MCISRSVIIHIHGANWETVRLAVRQQGGFLRHVPQVWPKETWDEKVAIAIKLIDQKSGLSKDAAARAHLTHKYYVSNKSS
jgi:hypothetical protein